jgi:hypothetical protein
MRIGKWAMPTSRPWRAERRVYTVTRNNDELGRMVLEAVADDYEELEMIVHDIAKCMSKVEDAPDKRQIELALMKSIADKDVKAYEVSETSGQLISTHADPQRIHTLWFYITEQGKESLRRLEDEESKSGIYMAGWEFDPGGGWRRSGE